MASQDPLFPILEDANGNGVSPLVKQEGDVVGGNEVAVLAAKDSSGNNAKIPLGSDGRVPVSLAAIGTKLRQSGKATTGIPGSDVTVVTITLTVDEVYQMEYFNLSCMRECEWRIEHNDNGTPVVLLQGVTNPGANAASDCCDCIEFTAGSTGTQELKIIMNQLAGGQHSDMYGNLCIIDLA